MRYDFALPTVMLISLIVLPEYTSRTQKVVEIPLIDSIYLNMLQVLKLKFVKIDKRGVQKRSKGVGTISKN